MGSRGQIYQFNAEGEAGSVASGGAGGCPAVPYLQALEAWYPGVHTRTGCLWAACSALHIFCGLPVKQPRLGRAGGWESTPCLQLHLRAATNGYGPTVPREGSGAGQAFQTDVCGFLQLLAVMLSQFAFSSWVLRCPCNEKARSTIKS